MMLALGSRLKILYMIHSRFLEASVASSLCAESMYTLIVCLGTPSKVFRVQTMLRSYAFMSCADEALVDMCYQKPPRLSAWVWKHLPPFMYSRFWRWVSTSEWMSIFL